MTVQKKIKYHPDVTNCFKELPFQNTYIEKPKIKCLKNIDLLCELSLCEQLSVIKRGQAIKGYKMSQKVEIIQKKDSLIQLKASKSNIKDLFNDCLDETKGFKYQITLNKLKILAKRN